MYSASSEAWSGLTERYGAIRLQRVTPPSTEPLTLAQAKAYLKVDFDADDTLITAMIAEARAWAEAITRRALIDQEWLMVMDRFPVQSRHNPFGEILLPFGKCLSVQSITYTDTAGVEQHMYGASSGNSPPSADYQEDLRDSYGGIIRPNKNTYWPATDGILGAVEVAFTVGYGDAADVDGGIMSALKFKLADLYETRGEQDARLTSQTGLAVTAERLIGPFIIHKF